MVKLKEIDLGIDKNHLTINVLISQVLKAICYLLDLITKSIGLTLKGKTETFLLTCTSKVPFRIFGNLI